MASCFIRRESSQKRNRRWQTDNKSHTRKGCPRTTKELRPKLLRESAPQFTVLPACKDAGSISLDSHKQAGLRNATSLSLGTRTVLAQLHRLFLPIFGGAQGRWRL
jgi:hypothetical protein